MKDGEFTEETRYWLTLGKCVRQRRIKAELSQEQMAKKAGISRAELQFIEVGLRRAKLDTLQRCCKALRMSVVELLAQVDFCQAEELRSRLG